MRSRTGSVVLCAFLANGCGGSSGPPGAAWGAEGIASRLLPGYGQQVSVERIPAQDGLDVFELETLGGKLVVRGSSGVAVASGLNHYLKHYGNGHLSWGGDRVDLGARLPQVEKTVRRTSPYRDRYMYNFTVHGYTTPYWDWKRWEREIDLIAASGFNLALVTVGCEKALVETFSGFGYSPEELRDWIVPPAHQPWQWMGNIQDEGPPLPPELIEERAALGRRILARMRDLGIRPVLPGYYGLVPPGFAERSGRDYDVKEQGTWLGAYPRPDLLNPADTAHFEEVADAYYAALRSVLGDARYFAADPFHEGGDTSGIDIQLAATNIQSAMLRANPDAIWVIQAWLGNPRDGLLAGLRPPHALIVDLWGDELPAYKRFTSDGRSAFRGIPWVWSIIQNFGGNTGLTGNLAVIAGQYETDGAFSDPGRGDLVGLGVTMEGTEQNPVVLDLISDMIWRAPQEGPIELDQWIQDYADRRYGKRLAAARRAWIELEDTVYSTTPGLQQGTVESIVCARPDLNADNVSTFGPRGGPYYDTGLLEQALGDLLAVKTQLQGVATYEYDLVDVTRQVLANRARALLANLRGAFESRDRGRFDRLSRDFLTLIDDEDRLLATREEFLLGRWLQAARAWGTTREEADLLERDARMILTTWSETDTLLRDYAHREWAGLLAGYYRRRWELYFAYLKDQLDGSDPAPPDFFAMESAWVNETDPDGTSYPVLPAGDPIAVSEELYLKYAAAPGS